MSRLMKSGLDLEPPERRIGLAAHDFRMAMGAERSGAVARGARRRRACRRVALAAAPHHLRRPGAGRAMRARGDELLAWARALDAGTEVSRSSGPQPKPPLKARPKASRSPRSRPCAAIPMPIYAKAFSKLVPLDPLLRDPGAAERGTLFHDILHRFARPRRRPSARGGGRSCSPRPGLLWPRRPAGRRRGGVVAAFRCAGRKDHRLGAAAKR